MAEANRTFPTETNTPDDITGAAYAEKIEAEGKALWDRVITNTADVGGTANAIEAVCVPPLTADPADGQTFVITPVADNTGAVSVALDGIDPIDLKDIDGNDLVAGDIVTGRPVAVRRHGEAGSFRLRDQTERALLAALAAEIEDGAEVILIADTTVTVPATTIEHVFTPGAFARLIAVFSDMTPASSSPQFDVQLRNASTTILNHANVSNADNNGWTGDVTYTLGLINTNKIYLGKLIGGNNSGSVVESTIKNSTSNIPDRVRFQFSGANILRGRMITYGFRAR